MSLMVMERVFGLLDATPEIVNNPGAVKLKGVQKAIEYKDVCFKYVNDKPVLWHINLKIAKGETIAFVVNSGGDKSTMVNILPHFYDIKSGLLMIDDADVRDIELNSLCDNIAIVFQDNFLFSGSI